MAFIKNKKTRALIFIMCALVALGLIVANLHYSRVNNSVDPRIVKARTLYEKYNKYASLNQFDSIVYLMDSIENVYAQIDHYKNSYEIGVIHNNRAATFITQALFYSGVDSTLMDSLICKAEITTRKSINIYKNWLSLYSEKEPKLLDEIIRRDFFKGLEKYSDKEQLSYFKNRKKEVNEALLENKRRLSVSYTNLGIVYRHRTNYDSAAILYQKAIELWDQNITAKNNLNILLDRPLEKRLFLQKLFPPEKN